MKRDEADFFSRSISAWGNEKMSLLRGAEVAVAGVGGFGCVVSELLVRSGVGRLILIDNGVVDVPDLNRQILYSMKDVGSRKAERAADTLRDISPFTEIIPFGLRIGDDDQPERIFREEGCTVIADCLDNFEGRFALERAVPPSAFLVHGGVERDYGQVTTVVRGRTPSLRDLYCDTVASAGAVAVTPPVVSAIGSVMAHEVLNVLWGEPSLQGKMLIVEFADFSVFHLALQ